MLVCCSRPRPDMILANPFDSGHAWVNYLRGNSPRNSCLPIRTMKPESSNWKSGWGKPCPFMSPNLLLRTESFRFFINIHGSVLSLRVLSALCVLNTPALALIVMVRAEGTRVLARRVSSTGGKSGLQGQGRWITSRRSDPTPAPQRIDRRWPMRWASVHGSGSGKGETVG